MYSNFFKEEFLEMKDLNLKIRKSEIRGGGILSSRGKQIATVVLIVLVIASVFFYDFYCDWKHNQKFLGIWVDEKVEPGASMASIAQDWALPNVIIFPERTLFVPPGVDVNEGIEFIKKNSITLKKLGRELRPGDRIALYLEIPRKDLTQSPPSIPKNSAGQKRPQK